MSQDTVMSIEERKQQALAIAKSKIQKGRTARTGTYLAMFITELNGLDDDSALERVEIVSNIAFTKTEAELEGEIDFENPEHTEAFDANVEKCKAQVAAAISNSQNNTSLSFNPTTKDKYELHKTEDNRYWISEK